MIFDEDNNQLGVPHWYFGKTRARSPTKLVPIPHTNSNSLALSDAHDWNYGTERFFGSRREEEEETSDEKEQDQCRRASAISVKDVNSRTTQLIFGIQGGKRVPKLKEPRSLYCVPRDVVLPRWPIGVDIICPSPELLHNHCPPPFVEEFYKRPHGQNIRLLEKVDTDRLEGQVVYQLPLMRFPFYTRSRPTATLEVGDYPLNKYDDDILRFESRFECGNLFKARRVGPYEYELELRWDYFTMKHTQWFYFRASNTKAGPTYKFTIINLLKSGSLYNEGMKPLFYSEQNSKTKNLGWTRIGQNIHYYRNNIRRKDCKGERYQYSLTWQFQFPHNGDVCYFAHCYPYGYTDLQKDLLEIANDPVKSQYVKQRILCHSLAGNMVHLLTVTTPSSHLTEAKQKRAVVVTARVHPGETNSSYMMRGFIDFITGSSPDAKVLRDNFVFKIVPMLNPDGVIVGNYRSSLAARDLNRNYKNPIKDAYPSIWSVKAMIRRMLTEREVVLYCDLHGHSRKMNVFMYGCENKDPTLRLQERVFPNMMGRNTSKFKYSSCRFKVQKKKEGTGRIVMWQQMGILNSFTMEATFAGYNNVHFNSRDLEDMGYHFCDTLLDYCDPDTSKVDHVLANLTRIVKAQYAAKLGKNLDDLTDIPLEELDFSELESSDGGSDSSVSDGPPKLPLLRKKCAPLQPKKKYKTRKERNLIHRQSKRRNSKQTADQNKSTPQSSTADASLKKEDRSTKPKPDRRGSVSSTESPSVIAARQAHGIPKHAQERIEERQAKVNKEPDKGEYSAVTAGIFHPASSRDHDSSSPVGVKSCNSGSDSRKSLEPAKVAFSTKELDKDTVYAVLEPTEQMQNGECHPDAVATVEQDGISMSVVLSGTGSNIYQHNQVFPDGQPETGDNSNYPYSVNYRTNDVNSRRLGKNSFAIRPTKSAHRSHRSKMALPSTKSEVLTTDNPDQTVHLNQLRDPYIVTQSKGYSTESKSYIGADPRNGNLGLSSPLFGKSTYSTHSNSNNPRTPVLYNSPNVSSGHGTRGSHKPDQAQPVMLSLDNKPEHRDLMKVKSLHSMHAAAHPDHGPDMQQHGDRARNFTSSYVDKILSGKRHSVPKINNSTIAKALSDTKSDKKTEHPRRHRSLASLHKQPEYHTTKPPDYYCIGNRTNNNQHRMYKLVDDKAVKHTSITWSAVTPDRKERYSPVKTPKELKKVGQYQVRAVQTPGSSPTRNNICRYKGSRMGFKPQKL